MNYYQFLNFCSNARSLECFQKFSKILKMIIGKEALKNGNGFNFRKSTRMTAKKSKFLDC